MCEIQCYIKVVENQTRHEISLLTFPCFKLESDWLHLQTQHPSSIEKIRDLETPKMQEKSDDDTIYTIPTFTQHLNDLEVKENGTAIFECKVEPSSDPAMKIGKI